MKKLFFLLLPVALFNLFSCRQDDSAKNKATDQEKKKNIERVDPVEDTVYSTDWNKLTADYMTWYTYTYYNVRLSQDFTGLDVDSSIIDKKTFLNSLISRPVVAFKVKVVKGFPVYQLHRLNAADESILATSRQTAERELVHFNMEGKPVPAFHFTDLNGIHYDNASLKGKLLVLKCWFIHCVACVKEFPELNKLRDKYRNQQDLVFLSLASDKKAQLEKFLTTKEFKYATVPEAGTFMNEQLHITEFPTHLLIGRDGRIIKVVNQVEDLVPFLKREFEIDLLRQVL